MAECRHALPGEREQTHRLWQQVFGDEPQAQEVFYDLCAPQGPLVLVEAGQVACMLALTPVELALPGCTASRGTYLYALATRPDCRGKGYAARLIACAAAWTQEQGLDFVCTVPAQPSLFTFFSKNSFTPAFYHLRVPLPAPQAGPVEPLTPQAYGALREELLGNIPHIVHSPGQIAFEGQLHGALSAFCPDVGFHGVDARAPARFFDKLLFCFGVVGKHVDGYRYGQSVDVFHVVYMP